MSKNWSHAGRKVSMEVRTTASPEQVWTSFADPARVVQWFVDEADGKAVAGDKVAELIGGLNGEGYWLTPLVATSNPYTGAKAPEKADGDFSQTHVATGPTPRPIRPTTRRKSSRM